MWPSPEYRPVQKQAEKRLRTYQQIRHNDAYIAEVKRITGVHITYPINL